MDRLPKRMQQKIIPVTESGCWIWTGASHRYGTTFVNGKAKRAHRAVYELLIGEIPKGLELMHSCDIGLCVNPLHLNPGTHDENMKDMALKGRSRSGKYGDDHWTKKEPERAKAIAAKNIKNSHKSGFQNNNAKVTQEIINKVRELKTNNPKITFTEIGTQFGIGRETARKIVRGITWRI